MDICAYLDRIGYTGSEETSRENLEKLLRCHLETVPFENLECSGSGAPLSNALDVLYDKVVVRRRGGICFELNSLLYGLLSRMGYDCYMVEVRLYGSPTNPPRYSHAGVITVLDGKKYYCDVGYGGPGPKGLMPLEEGPEQTVSGARFQVGQEGCYTHLRRFHEGSWVNMIAFADVPCMIEDFTARLYYAAMHPQSSFVTRKTVNICLPCGGSKALTGNHLTIRRDGELYEEDLETEEAYNRALQEEFGIFL